MGAPVITTVLTAAATYDLIDLDTVKSELSIDPSDSSQDALLGRAITQVSQAIARFCNRVFAVEKVQDDIYIDQDPYPYQVPGNIALLQLSRFPLLTVSSVQQTLALGQTQSLVVNQDYRVDAKNGALIRLNSFTGVATTWEALPVSVVYSAGYGLEITQAATIPASPGPYTITVSQQAEFSLDEGVTFSGGTALVPVPANPAAGQYSVSAGEYTFSSSDAGKPVNIAYGYNAIPADLVEACLRLITNRYKARSRDPALVQRDTPGVGTERFWFGGVPGQKGAFPPDIQAILDNYRTPVIA